MNSLINPQLVLDKISELLKHKNTKDTFQKGIKTEKMETSEFLTNSSKYPYKLTYSYTYEEFVKQRIIENTHQQKIKKLVTDGGGEFINQQFEELEEQHVFIHIIAPPYTPEHNRIAERANKTIMDKARCLLLSSCLPNQYWAEAVNTATYSPTYYLCHQERICHLISYGQINLPQSKRFEPLDASSDNEHSSLESCLPPAFRQIKVIRPQHPTLINSDITEENILPYSRQPAALLTETDPLTYNKAIKSDNCEYWIKVIKKELQTMIDLNVWEEGAIEDNYKLIGTTWVFKTKRDGLNNIIEHKECLCAQGFSQMQGKDYSKKFSPTGQLNSLRTLISHSAANNLRFKQLDIKSAFLNAPLDEDVYLAIPQGFDRDKSNVCLKLMKAIYGLKQAPLAWYHRLSLWLVKFGCSISKADSCVFYLKGNEPI
ncbi:hypothetical protein O181_038760 [Austropuccinia psidii MF-1]|uniref:Integrase catalytic domain-containing protein n=1 Tax=Austropuccinia psidii MF-1 TaxID=1389203 RepID=A0A9Q3HEG1_9BASI|nr:hypothetical protein [Austropuccinia psidii MF-1]